MLAKGEEEAPYDHADKQVENVVEECHELQTEEGKKEKKWNELLTESQNNFCALDDNTKASAKSFSMRYGNDADEVVQWKILSEVEQITEGCMNHPDTDDTSFNYNIPWDQDPNKVDYNKVLLDHFFPSLVGKAKVLDEFLCRDNST